ncbi:MAG TPA: DegT/DnrJ/EryC1/StrS family aminotransferase [Terriglobia bacterium]|nr:DegT/DnrJ/EryC1/StrS family aminotransferase [Terriglobia bacterium]
METFQKEFVVFLGARYAVAVSSGPGALPVAFWDLGVGLGQAVIFMHPHGVSNIIIMEWGLHFTPKTRTSRNMPVSTQVDFRGTWRKMRSRTQAMSAELDWRPTACPGGASYLPFPRV